MKPLTHLLSFNPPQTLRGRTIIFPLPPFTEKETEAQSRPRTDKRLTRGGARFRSWVCPTAIGDLSWIELALSLGWRRADTHSSIRSSGNLIRNASCLPEAWEVRPPFLYFYGPSAWAVSRIP